jgi:Plasmid pRiA4b ORF-3-like protein/Domain of unknown function (DUF6930)
MPAKIVKIETALIARLPQARDEVWEVGRRRLDISVAELERQGERPALLLAVQASGQGGVIQASIVPASAPLTALADVVLQGMRQPMMGKPRRPQLIRVNSQTEAEALSDTLTTVGVRLEVSTTLVILDAVLEEMATAFGGVAGDYRTQAARAGESLSDEGLRELFRAARAFYRAELWLEFGDDVMFEIQLQPVHGSSKTLYGIVLGNMGQEFGLALYASLDEFRRFYEFSLQHLDQLEQPEKTVGKGRSTKKRQQQEDEMLAQLASVSAVGVTFTPQRDVPPPLVQEAKQLRLPLANKSAFPLVMRLGAGGMTVGTINDLRDVYAALQAILDWDQRIAAMEVDDEIDVTITSELSAIADFLPAMTAHTTLRLNPYAPDEEPALPSELHEFLNAVFNAPSAPAAAAASTSRRPAHDQTRQARAPKSPSKPAAAKSPHVYSLRVYLTGGLVSDAYSGREISRTIQLLGHQTLHDLHKAIFKAFDRFDEHLYEFNLGKGPDDRSQRYLYGGGWDDKRTKGRDPETTTIDSLKLRAGRRFGYTFDMGDNWEHVIDVVSVEEAPAKGKYPRVTKKVGASPPQYPDEDET